MNYLNSKNSLNLQTKNKYGFTRTQTVKEHTRLGDYLNERQQILNSQLPNKKVDFLQESEKDVLLEKLRSVNSMMKHLIDNDTKTSQTFNTQQNHKLLDMVQGTLRKRVQQRSETTSKKQKDVQTNINPSAAQLIERFRNKSSIQKQEYSKHLCTDYNRPERKQISSSQYFQIFKKKYSDTLKVEQPSYTQRFSYSDNHIRSKKSL